MMNQWMETTTTMETTTDFFDFDDLDMSTTRKNKSRERRVTLSPASARATIGELDKRRQSIDIELLPIQDFEANTEPVGLPPIIDDFTVNSLSFNVENSMVEMKPSNIQDSDNVLKEKTSSLVSEIHSHDRLKEEKEMMDFKHELDALLADEDSVLVVEEVHVTFNRRQSILSPVDLKEMDITSPKSLEHSQARLPFTDVSTRTLNEIPQEHPILSPSKISATNESLTASNSSLESTQPETAEELVPLSVEDYLQMQQEKAYARLRLRMEQSWWKYQWEVVSSHAVVTAKEGEFRRTKDI